MISLQAYRQQIGYFNQVFRCRKKFSRMHAEYIPVQLRTQCFKFKSTRILQFFILVASILVLMTEKEMCKASHEPKLILTYAIYYIS